MAPGFRNINIGTTIVLYAGCNCYYGQFMGIENGQVILSGFPNYCSASITSPPNTANAVRRTVKIALSGIEAINVS